MPKVSEALKTRFNHGLPSNLYFWRDRAGHEVDLLLENTSQLIPVEIKSSQTLNTDFSSVLENWVTLAHPQQPRAGHRIPWQ